jgi:hypothetical protein
MRVSACTVSAIVALAILPLSGCRPPITQLAVPLGNSATKTTSIRDGRRDTRSFAG